MNGSAVTHATDRGAMTPVACAYLLTGPTEAARHARQRAIDALVGEYGDLTGWARSPQAARVAAPVAVRGFAAWAALHTHTPVDADYVSQCGTSWGHHAAVIDPDFAHTFRRVAHDLGFSPGQVTRQWATLAKLAAVAGRGPRDIDQATFTTARDDLTHALTRGDRDRLPTTFTTPLHGLEATLATLGRLDQPARRRPGGRRPEASWDTLAVHAPTLVTTMRRYLAQLALSLRPGSVALIDTSLRTFAGYLTAHHHEITCAAAVRRTHIEGFKAYLAARPGYRGNATPPRPPSACG